VSGANWRHPAGPASNLEGKANHPVVQVSYADALAYASWLGRALPTEVQWEFAASAARPARELESEPRDAQGRPLANFWQGEFPSHNTLQDGFETTAPVGCFAANPFGLFDMLGNVWEWTSSQYTSSHRSEDADDAAPSGESGEHCSSAAGAGTRFTLKGGSFLCSATFCARYRVAARHAQEADQPAMHIGFRTVLPGP
jgi:formylglycine-generating enzyme required for sulfatase activity